MRVNTSVPTSVMICCNMRNLSHILYRDFRQEWRQSAIWLSVVLFMVGSVYITSLCFNAKMDKPSWNAVFWIMLLFTSLSLSVRSLNASSQGYALYQFLLFNPIDFIIARWLFQVILALVLNLLTVLVYGWFMGFSVQRPALFLSITVLNTLAAASVLVFTNALTSYVSAGFSLLSILSIPLLIPVYSISVKLGKQAMDGIENAAFRWDLMGILCAVFLISFGLLILLFPYLWRSR